MKSLAIVLCLLVLASAGWDKGYDYDYKDENCKEFDKKGMCIRCVDGFFVFNGMCLDCKFGVDWCEDCSPDGRVCFECEKGFFLVNERMCGICFNGIANCKFCSQKGDTCFECLEPYTLKDNMCVFEPKPPVYEPKKEYGYYGYP